MTDSIYVVAQDGALAAAPRTPYALEDDLQKLIADHPELLPGEQIDPESPRRWRLIKREAGIGSATATSRWSLDHLFVDQDAIPTLVEAKRGGNPEARREVVAQLLEYAANGSLYWPMDQLRSWFEAQSGDRVAAMASIADLTEAEPTEEAFEAFWDLFETNLRDRRIRLIFVADDIPSELRTLVEFLNEQMAKVEVLAVEIVQYASEGRQLLKPQLIGQTATARAKKDATGRRQRRDQRWTVDEIVSALAAISDEAGTYGSLIASWAEGRGDLIKQGNRGLTWPGVAYKMVTPARQTRTGRPVTTVFTLLAVADNILEIPFGNLRELRPFDDPARVRQLHEGLRPFARMARNDPDTEAYAYAGINELRSAENLQALLGLLGAALDEIAHSEAPAS